MVHFGQRLDARVREVGSATCVGLDPHLDRLPSVLQPGANRAARASAAESFCLGVIDAVGDVVAAVKPQVAFFEQLGSAGVAALERVVIAARQRGLLVVLDAKRGDIGSTARAYATATLSDDGPLAADAVTLSPYLGPESLEPFLDPCAAGKGLFILVRTSNPGAGPWQDGIAPSVADWIRRANADFDGLGPVGAVVGATVEAEIVRTCRAQMPKAWFLAPGVGAQGASPAATRPHLDATGTGALVVSARAVLYPVDGTDSFGWQDDVHQRARAFAQAVRTAHTEVSA